MFLSNYVNKIDKKGRVSVPATFRSNLNSMGYNGFISYPSFNHPALEACSQDRIEKLSNTIDTLNPFEEKRDFFATSILSESENLQFDTEGRVSISQKLLSHAKIKNNVLFVGLGKTFVGLINKKSPSCQATKRATRLPAETPRACFGWQQGKIFGLFVKDRQRPRARAR